MLADPQSKKRPRDANEYNEDEFHAALALLTQNNEHDNKKRKQKEYWSDSENDDWPKYDDNNEHPFVRATGTTDINVQEPVKKQIKPQPTSKQVRPSGNVPATSMERLDYAIASRKNKPRGWSIGGRKRSQRKRSQRKRTGKRRTRKTKRKTRRRKTKHTRKRGGSNKNKKQLSLDVVPNLYVPKDNQNEYKVEDPNAPPGTLGNMAQIRGRHPNTRTPTFNPIKGKFE